MITVGVGTLVVVGIVVVVVVASMIVVSDGVTLSVVSIEA